MRRKSKESLDLQQGDQADKAGDAEGFTNIPLGQDVPGGANEPVILLSLRTISDEDLYRAETETKKSDKEEPALTVKQESTKAKSLGKLFRNGAASARMGAGTLRRTVGNTLSRKGSSLGRRTFSEPSSAVAQEGAGVGEPVSS